MYVDLIFGFWWKVVIIRTCLILIYVKETMALKEPQTISIYWFYLLRNHVDTQLNQSNLLLTPFYDYKMQFISNKLRPSSLTWPALWTSFSFLAQKISIFETSH